MLGSRRKINLLLLALVCAEITAALEISMILAALRTLMRHFSPTEVGWVVSSFGLTAASSAALGGRLGDIYGRRRVLVIMLAVACIGSVISLFTQSIELLIVGRVIQGMSGGITPLCYAIAREALPKERVSPAMGLLSATTAASIGGGLVVGGLIVDTLGWHMVFLVSAVAAALGAICVLAFVPPSARAALKGRVDYIGGLLFVPAIACLLLVISDGSELGSTFLAASIAAAGLAMLAAWAVYESRHPEPLFAVRLLATRNVALSNLCMVLIGLSTLQLPQVAALLFQQPLWTGAGLGLSATAAGVFKIPSSISAMFSSGVAGKMGNRFKPRHLVTFGALISTSGWALLAFEHNSLALVILATVWTSFGTGFIYVNIPLVLLASVPLDRAGEASGILIVTRSISMSIGAQLMLVLLSITTVVNTAKGPGNYPAAGAWNITLSAIAVVSLLIMAAAVFMRNEEVARSNAWEQP